MEVSHLGSCGIEGEELRHGLCLSGTAGFFGWKKGGDLTLVLKIVPFSIDCVVVHQLVKFPHIPPGGTGLAFGQVVG